VLFSHVFEAVKCSSAEHVGVDDATAIQPEEINPDVALAYNPEAEDEIITEARPFFGDNEKGLIPEVTAPEQDELE
jgi:hypothetical protein